jgi:hypothetical protein
MATLVWKEWSFVPGPDTIVDPPGNSCELYDAADYRPADIARAILAYPGFQLLHPAVPSWWEWSAGWEAGDEMIDVSMTVNDAEPESWGGSGIDAICDVQRLIDLWQWLRVRFPCVWLHNGECEIHTPESFAVRYGSHS